MNESLFGASPQPSAAQVGGSFEIGNHFTASNAGNVTGLAFYKSAADTATGRNLSLWSSAGLLLTGVTTSGEPTGSAQWLVGALNPPYAIQATLDYVTSFSSPVAFMYLAGGTVPFSNGKNLTCTSSVYSNAIGTFPSLNNAPDLGLVDLVFAATQTQVRLSSPIPTIQVAVPGELTNVMNGVVAALNQTCTNNGLSALPYFVHVKVEELPAALNTMINSFNTMLDQLGWDAANHLSPADVTSYRQATQLINVLINQMNAFA